VSRPHVIVVGGGLAGLSGAVACADAGARVTLLEERARLGGATWSSQQQGLWIDNGQHVFLRCCESYRAFLRRLGVENGVELQRRLEIPVIAPGGRTRVLRRSNHPAPLHLLGSLLRYGHIGIRDRLRIAPAARELARLDPADDALDAYSFGAWLSECGQSERAIERFWNLFTRATLNLPAWEASLSLAATVFQIGLLGHKSAGDIGYARIPLQQLHAEPAARVLARAGAEMRLRAPMDRIEIDSSGYPAAWCAGDRIAGDALVLAVPHAAAAALLPAATSIDREGLAALGASPIINLHVVYDRRVTRRAFAAAVGSPVQWVFDRSHAAGLDRGQYLALTLSAADAYLGLSRAELQRVFAPALVRLFPAARGARIERFFATCERAATFRQAPGTRHLRPGCSTGLARVFVAGAWTDTGWPDTMEGAVRSGWAAASRALDSIGYRNRPPAKAA
jgi:squalene-associated FAD-dependent desaturase